MTTRRPTAAFTLLAAALMVLALNGSSARPVRCDDTAQEVTA